MPSVPEIRAAVRTLENDLCEFTRALVAIPSENPPGNAYDKCVRAIAEQLRGLALPCEIVDLMDHDRSDEVPLRCVITSYGSGERTLYFHGHYDVVPVSMPGQCKPRLEGAHLFGRGAADMKSGLAAMLYAVKALQQLVTPDQLQGRVAVVMVPDEETGGARGSQRLAAIGRLGRGGIGMLTAEPTGGVIWNASRGAVSMRVTVKGRPAHVGLHYTGVNAFERMLAVARALDELKTRVETRTTRFNIEPERARASILLLGGRSEGGSNFNVVPGECAFTVDRRINPEEDLAAEKRALLEVIDRARQDGIDVGVDVFQEGRATGVPESDPLALALADSVEAVTGRRPAFQMCPGLLETRFYVEAGVPALAYGPGRLEVSHDPNEYVHLDRVAECAVVYALVALKMLGRGRKDVGRAGL